LGKDTIPLANENLSSAEILRFRDRAFEEYHGSECYLDMIRNKFGIEAVEHIKVMLEHKLIRKHA